MEQEGQGVYLCEDLGKEQKEMSAPAEGVDQRMEDAENGKDEPNDVAGREQGEENNSGHKKKGGDRKNRKKKKEKDKKKGAKKQKGSIIVSLPNYETFKNMADLIHDPQERARHLGTAPMEPPPPGRVKRLLSILGKGEKRKDSRYQPQSEREQWQPITDPAQDQHKDERSQSLPPKPLTIPPAADPAINSTTSVFEDNSTPRDQPPPLPPPSTSPSVPPPLLAEPVPPPPQQESAQPRHGTPPNKINTNVDSGTSVLEYDAGDVLLAIAIDSHKAGHAFELSFVEGYSTPPPKELPSRLLLERCRLLFYPPPPTNTLREGMSSRCWTDRRAIGGRAG